MSFDIWHQRLIHAGSNNICLMLSNKLVDSLNIYRELNIGGLCKDYIFSKHMAYLFNNTRQIEAYILKHIYIDIWGPAPVYLARGAVYFITLTDDFFSYWTIAFLSGKSADTTLKVLKAYYIKAKKQTCWKLKKVQLDMGRNWYNNS